jgi:hypothetical protein
MLASDSLSPFLLQSGRSLKRRRVVMFMRRTAQLDVPCVRNASLSISGGSGMSKRMHTE